MTEAKILSEILAEQVNEVATGFDGLGHIGLELAHETLLLPDAPAANPHAAAILV